MIKLEEYTELLFKRLERKSYIKEVKLRGFGIIEFTTIDGRVWEIDIIEFNKLRLSITFHYREKGSNSSIANITWLEFEKRFEEDLKIEGVLIMLRFDQLTDKQKTSSNKRNGNNYE